MKRWQIFASNYELPMSLTEYFGLPIPQRLLLEENQKEITESKQKAISEASGKKKTH
jgi:hypothetical protein